MDNIVGMFWNKDEGDILWETMTDAIRHVDSLFIADDGSTDGSKDLINDFAAQNKDKVEYVYTGPRNDPRDTGNRQHLLTEIQKRYKGENTWVQIIESDIMILDTDIRVALEEWGSEDIGMSWHLINAARRPGEWAGVSEQYPNWEAPIVELMPLGHWIEVMMYTFRPMPKVCYNFDRWRPWPQGLSYYTDNRPIEIRRRGLSAPLLAHYGYRGPLHWYEKWRRAGKTSSRKYPKWNYSSPEKVEETVYFFNGAWNGEGSLFPMSREGWIAWRKG